MLGWKKKEAQPQTFSDIMRGMQYAVNTAQQVLERHHLYLLSKYFDAETRNAKTMRFLLPDNKCLVVPEIALIKQNSLNIDQMEIEFETKVNGMVLKEETVDGEKIDRSCFDMNFTPSSREGDVMKVKIKFKSGEQPEGVSRVVDEYTKLILPISLEV